MIKLRADAQAGPQLNGVFGDDEDEDALAASLKKILLPKKLRRLAIRDALININLGGLDHECLPAAEQGNKLATAKVCLSVQLFNFVLHFVSPAMCQVNLHDKGILKPFVFAVKLTQFLFLKPGCMFHLQMFEFGNGSAIRHQGEFWFV